MKVLIQIFMKYFLFDKSVNSSGKILLLFEQYLRFSKKEKESQKVILLEFSINIIAGQRKILILIQPKI